jgi:hypothetical protein
MVLLMCWMLMMAPAALHQYRANLYIKLKFKVAALENFFPDMRQEHCYACTFIFFADANYLPTPSVLSTGRPTLLPMDC